LCYALACFASAALMFFLKREHGLVEQLFWVFGLVIAGVLILLGTIVAAFFPLSPIPGWVGYGICFCTEAVILVIMLVLLWLSTRKGHYINLYLIACVITPLAMGAAFIGIFILLVDDDDVGQTFLMVIVIIAIVCAFIYGCALLVVAGLFLWLAIARGEWAAQILWIIAAIVCGILCIIGAIVAAFYALSYPATIAGLGLCFVIQGIIVIVFVVGYFLGRHDIEDGLISFALALKWGRLSLILINAVFAGISCVGVLAAATADIIA